MKRTVLIGAIVFVATVLSTASGAQSLLEKAEARKGDLRFSSYTTSDCVERLATDEAVRMRAWQTIQRMGLTKLYIEVYRG